MHRERVSPNNENDTLNAKQMKNFFYHGKNVSPAPVIKIILFLGCGFIDIIKQHAGMK